MNIGDRVSLTKSGVDYLPGTVVSITDQGSESAMVEVRFNIGPALGGTPREAEHFTGSYPIEDLRLYPE